MSDNGEAIAVVILCLVSAGLASGLTQGLVSLDPMELSIKEQSGTEIEKNYAKSLLPLIKRHHLMLVSLLLWNACAMEILPLFLDELVGPIIAIVLSVTLILFVGEIIPAAVLTGPKKLQLAYHLSPLVKFVMIFFYPLAYPIALLLDFILGKDEGFKTYNRLELSAMVSIQQRERQKRDAIIAHRLETDDSNQEINHSEFTIIGRVLQFREKLVREVMTADIFMLHIDERLSLQTLDKVFKSGFSRIPIYETDKNDIVGLVLTKDLIFVDPKDEVLIRSFLTMFGRPVQAVWFDDKLTHVFQKFKQSKGHLAIVRDVENKEERDPVYVVRGIITLEDIFEEIIGEEIMDETDDIASDNHRDIKRSRAQLLAHSELQLHSQMSREKVVALALQRQQSFTTFPSRPTTPSSSLPIEVVVDQCIREPGATSEYIPVAAKDEEIIQKAYYQASSAVQK